MARKERKTVNINALDSANSTTIPVMGSTSIVYTKAIAIGDAATLGIHAALGVYATGSANMTIVVEQSYELPLVEGSAHPSYIVTDTVMNTSGTITTLNSHTTVTLRGMSYARARATGAKTPTIPNTSAYCTVTFCKQTEG